MNLILLLNVYLVNAAPIDSTEAHWTAQKIPRKKHDRSDHFGYSLAAREDGVLVGDPTNQGHIWLYENDRRISLKGTMNHNDISPLGMNLGVSVASHINVIVTGAPQRKDVLRNRTGCVFVFVKVDTDKWTQQQVLSSI
jgi:hypothetical protein